MPAGLTDRAPGTAYRSGDEPLVVTAGRNRTAGGSDTARAEVSGTRPVALDPAKRVAAAVLPRGTDRGATHVFGVALTDRPVASAGQDG
ncbi:hypothetical protein [Streptomyces werraensis]|uniref:hypothetical protein n=1 Tax=Streptomyces werraensis TaxID=68284 RepID=UPI00368368AB